MNMKTPMLRSSLVAAMMLAFSGSAGAAGLGRINVLSALGQPLRAEVEISASAEEIESMTAKIASPDAFQRANIEYSGVYSAVRMSIEKRTDKGAVLRISSTKPFSEPFVDLLLELNWAGGRLLREYTFLLDPTQDQPEGQKAVLQVEEPVVKPLDASGKKPAAGKRDKEPVVAAAKSDAVAKSDTDYTVKRGDTLSKVAAAVKPVEVSQEQMVAALYKANSEAFVGGNINRLRAGKVLKVPDAEESRQLAPREARKVILKASNFDDYRDKVATGVAESPAKESKAGQSSSGKVEPKVVDKAPASAAQKDTVAVTATQSGKATPKAAPADDAAAKAQIKTLQDELATRSKAVDEANSRAKDLEKQITELRKLVELKSQAAAEAQRKADEALKLAAASKADIGKAGKGGKKTDEKPTAESAPSEIVKPVPPVEASPVATPVVEPAPAASPVAVVEASVPAAVSEPVAAVSAPPKAAVTDETFAPAEEEGTNPWPLVGLGFIGVVLAYVGLKYRKRKKSGEDLSQLSEVSTTSPNSVFGNAVGQTIDTGGTSLLHTDFSQSGMSAIDADEGVDPVAEADVYMAYGRDAQAEEILLDALKTDPGRNAIYIKLLEIYAARRSVKQFENVAADLHVRTGGTGDDWAKAVALGLQLDPSNPLFRPAQAAPVEAVPVVDLSATPAPVTSVVAPVAAAVEMAAAAESPAPVSFGTNNVSQMRSTWTVPGDINQLSATSGAGEMPLIVDLPQATGTASIPDSLNLDFNLDLDSPDVEDLPTRIEPREELPALNSAPAAVAEPQLDVVEDVPLEFDIGLDDSAIQTGGTAEAKASFVTSFAPSHAPAASVASDGQDDFDVGIESAHRDSLAEVDLEKTNFEGSLLDFDFELSDDSQKPTLDLSSVNLRTPVAAPAPVVAPPAAVDLPDIGDSFDVNDEVTTKLELARAYEEMGDVEGARELLDEVVADGSSAQKDEARAIMQRLGA